MQARLPPTMLTPNKLSHIFANILILHLWLRNNCLSSRPEHISGYEGLFSIPKRLYVYKKKKTKKKKKKKKEEEEDEEEEEEKQKNTPSFSQPTSLIARGRAEAILPSVIHLCQTTCRYLQTDMIRRQNQMEI